MKPENWKQYFNSLAESGDAIRAGAYVNAGSLVTHDQLNKTANDIAIKMELTPSCRLLDVGCGGGLMLDRLSHRVALAIGVDFAQSSLKLCRPRHTVVAGNATALPFASGSFDRVMFYCAMMCLTDEYYARQVMDELFRVLAKGGVLFIGDVPDHDKREEYYHYTSHGRVRLPRLWYPRKIWRKCRDRIGVIPHNFKACWMGDYREYAMFPGAWFRTWAKTLPGRVKMEMLRTRAIPSGRGTDPFRYDVKISRGT